MVNVGLTHPHADSKGFCPLHVLIWVAAGNERARKKNRQLLHHRNENKKDNRLENLVLLKHDEHTDYHNAISRFRKQEWSSEDDTYPNLENMK